jgi:hypothetical protein
MYSIIDDEWPDCAVALRRRLQSFTASQADSSLVTGVTADARAMG